MSIETRQHELFGLDLGEGAPRKALAAGLLIFVVWFALLTALLGLPSKATATLYFLPPGLLTVFGWQESPTNPRRRRITEWVLVARWIIRGHRPVIGLGRRTGRGYERRATARVADRLGGGDLMTLIAPWRAQEQVVHARTHARKVRTGRAARYGGRVELVGTSAADALMKKRTKGRGRKP